MRVTITHDALSEKIENWKIKNSSPKVIILQLGNVAWMVNCGDCCSWLESPQPDQAMEQSGWVTLNEMKDQSNVVDGPRRLQLLFLATETSSIFVR